MTGTVDIAAAGDHALLIELDRTIGAPELHAAAARVRALAGVLACIAGHSSLYVIFEDWPDADAARLAVQASPSQQPVIGSQQHVLPVSFCDEYAPDLSELLTRTGTTRENFLARLENLPLVVRYLGFRGGFAYLDGWPAEWSMPRRPTSRPVACGSFGIAGGVAGFYPIDSPGGWNLLGRTAVELENRFAAGDEITIVPTLDELQFSARPKSRNETIDGIEIISAPLAVVVRDADWARLDRGSAPGGPFDAGAAEAANVAVGNEPHAPLLECAQAGPRIRATDDVVAAWVEGDRTLVHRLRAGETFDAGKVSDGLRGYLAIGTRPGELRQLHRDQRLTILTMRGPHDIGLQRIECEVTPSLDRVGIRLRPLQAISANIPADLPSAGMQFGTLQLHPDGTIVAMGPEHPVTGGYLQPMTVLWPERWKLAHLAPGERVRFVAQSP